MLILCKALNCGLNDPCNIPLQKRKLDLLHTYSICIINLKHISQPTYTNTTVLFMISMFPVGETTALAGKGTCPPLDSYAVAKLSFEPK